MTIVAEAGDLRRFPTARAFMAYVGLVPSEYSSGDSRHRGHITKTGNGRVRHVLGQAAHNAHDRPIVAGSKWESKRETGLEPVTFSPGAAAQQSGGPDRSQSSIQRASVRCRRTQCG